LDPSQLAEELGKNYFQGQRDLPWLGNLIVRWLDLFIQLLETYTEGTEQDFYRKFKREGSKGRKGLLQFFIT